MAAAQEASPQQVTAFLSLSPKRAPENTPEVFLVFCGVLALGRYVAAGNRASLATLRHYASDPRWRIREAVAMALQSVGDTNMKLLIREMRLWAGGNWLEKRAAAAALAEPRLLRASASVSSALRILDLITQSIISRPDKNTEDFRVLRQALGYCWSVVVASNPGLGMPAFEKWLKTDDPDVRHLLRENLRKNRLLRMDAKWVQSCLAKLGFRNTSK